MKRDREEEVAGEGGTKRPREEPEGGAAGVSEQQHADAVAADSRGEQAAGGGEQQAVAADEGSGGGAADEDDKPLYSNFRMSSAVRRGNECPYLDTISRQVCTTAGGQSYEFQQVHAIAGLLNTA